MCNALFDCTNYNACIVLLIVHVCYCIFFNKNINKKKKKKKICQ